MKNLEDLSARLHFPSYLIDDQTALKIVDGEIEVISEGKWKLVEV
jgi:dipeptidase E